MSALVVDREEEILGINSRAELAAMSQRVWQARREALMASGVTLEDPATVYVDRGVTVGPTRSSGRAFRSSARRRLARAPSSTAACASSIPSWRTM